MSLWKSLKGQILLVSLACLVVALVALSAANLWTARSHAHASLASETQLLAHSHVETLRTWPTPRRPSWKLQARRWMTSSLPRRC